MEVACKDVTDFHRQGMVAFAEKNFRLAGENFRRSAEKKEQQVAEDLRGSAADRELAGDSSFNDLDYHRALEEYRRALTLLNTYKDSFGPLGIRTYPEHTVDVRRITLKSANAKRGLGERVAGPDSRRHLEEAVREYLGLIAQVPRSSDPRQWAQTQNNLGVALKALGQRQGGPEGLRRLSEAVETFRLALTVYTRDDLPQDWARTQNNLGNALRSLGERLGGPEGLQRLNEAVDAYRQALTVRTRDDLPQQWAGTQNNLGNALRGPGERLGGPEGQRRLNEAVETYRQALTVRKRDDLPQDWAMIQNNLGTAFSALGERLGGPEGQRRLNEAVETYRQALTVCTRDDLPQYWATTQKSLGTTLQIQVRLGGFPAGLEQVGRLAQAEGIRDDPVAQASLQVLAIVCHVATHQDAKASRAFASLVALVERQPADFHLVWGWTPLRDHLANEKAPPIPDRREPLRKLLDAVSRDNNKAAILTGLKEVQAAFPARAEEPAIPIRQAPFQR